MQTKEITIKQTATLLTVQQAMLDGSTFNDVSFKHVKITNADMSDLEIEGAQLGGAFLHNIGLPPTGHPLHNPNAKQRPLRFEDCDLNGLTLTNCNLGGAALTNCNTKGMTINGILVDDLMTIYHAAGNK